MPFIILRKFPFILSLIKGCWIFQMRWPLPRYQNLTKTLHCPISLSCHNKIPQNEWLNNRNLFLKVLQAGNSKFKVLAKLVSQWGPPFLAYRKMPSHCVLTCPHVVRRVSKQALVSSSSYKDTNPIMGASPIWPLPKLTAFQRSHLQIPSLWELGLQHVSFEETQILSPYTPPQKNYIPHKQRFSNH